jgi:hypothetical protein
MTLAATGHCYRDHWAQLGDSTPLAEEAVILLACEHCSHPLSSSG